MPEFRIDPYPRIEFLAMKDKPIINSGTQKITPYGIDWSAGWWNLETPVSCLKKNVTDSFKGKGKQEKCQDSSEQETHCSFHFFHCYPSEKSGQELTYFNGITIGESLVDNPALSYNDPMTQEYVKLAHGSPSYDNYFVVNWCFFSICNFSCSYCPEILHNGQKRGPDIQVVKNFCRRIVESKPDKRVFFEFTGGEVTFYKQFSELLEYLKTLGADAGLISNGSRPIEFWESHKNLIDHICLSFHPEQGNMDHFFEVVKLLNEVTTVHVNIMMLPTKFDELFGFAKKIASEVEGVSVAIQALFEGMNGSIYSYTTEQQQTLDRPSLPFGESIKFRKAPYETELSVSGLLIYLRRRCSG